MTPDHVKPLALVTGASSGIGYALAEEFARHGYDLVITADNPDKLAQAQRSLAAADGVPQVHSVTADLAHSQGVEHLYDAVRSLGRPVDLLAANAGIGVYGDFARETRLKDELRLIQLNVTSQVHLTKLIARDMVERGAGKILITSSIAALMPGPLYAVYAASKAFLHSFGEAIRNELADAGVSVTVLMPGPTDTAFFERADMEGTRVGEGPKQDPAEVARAAFKALQEDEDKVITGAKNKLQAGAARMLPDEARAKLHKAQAKPAH